MSGDVRHARARIVDDLPVEALDECIAPGGASAAWRRGSGWLRGLTGWRADLAAALLGALAAAALPPFFVLPMLLLSVPGLLALIDAAPHGRIAARRGFWFGFGHHLLGLYWITEAILMRAAEFWWLVPFAVPAVAAVLAVFIAAACWVARRAAPGWRRAVALAGAWVLADLARQFVLTGFPWNLWGADWTFPGRLGDVFIQPAAWVGVHGLTLATMLLAVTPALGRRAMLAGIAGLAAWAAGGAVRLTTPLPATPGISVMLVQGDIRENQKWDPTAKLAIFRRYLALTSEGAAALHGRKGVVVWPETASPFLLTTDAGARQAILAASSGVPALAGSVRFDNAGRPRNSLVAMTGNSHPLMYDKWRLVPFGEYQPDWLPLPVQLVPGGGFAPGPGPETLHVPGLPSVGVLICYEAIFSGEIVNKTDRPAWLVNITNDAWFGNSTGPRQHLAAARLRAVEEGLPLMRAANTGISAGFDAHGHELGRLRLGRMGVLVLQLPGALPATPFARFGLAIPAVLALATLAVGFLPRQRLLLTLVVELRRLRSKNLADNLPRYPQFTADRLDRLSLNKIRPPNLRDRLHHQHPDPDPRLPREPP